MNEDALEGICMLLKREGVYSDVIKARLIVLLSDYEITKKSTELTLYDEDEYNEFVMKKFIIAKTVAGLTERTIKHYKNTMDFVLKRIKKPINIISADDLKLYLAVRQTKDGVSEVSVQNEWSVLSAFFGWLLKEEMIEKNPMYKVDKPKQRKKKKKAFTQMECEKLRNECLTLKEKALVELLLSTWCRVSEVEQINKSAIEGDQITVVGKGKKERTVYLNSKAMFAIDKYIKSRNDDNDALFVIDVKPHRRMTANWIERTIRELGKRAGVENTHPHRFRRTGATFALRSGMPIERVSYILGHESIETTQIYLDINEEEAKMAHKKWVQ